MDIQAGLELLQGWSQDNLRGESIPVIYDSHTETVSSNPQFRLLLAQFQPQLEPHFNFSALTQASLMLLPGNNEFSV